MDRCTPDPLANRLPSDLKPEHEKIQYPVFEQQVIERLSGHLSRTDDVDSWIDTLVERILHDANDLGPKLQTMFSEELCPGSREAQRQSTRFDSQVNLIELWWVEKIGTPPPSTGAIDALILLLSGAELRIAQSQDKNEMQRLKQAISYVIGAAVRRLHSA